MQAIATLFPVIIHILAGSLTLIAGPIAIFANQRYVRLHRIAGKTFFIAMNVVCISAVIGFLKRPDEVFYQFLLGIAVLVYAGILRGVRAIKIMKGSEVLRFDFVYTAFLGAFSVWMLGMSVWHLSRGTMIAFPILFGIFGLGALKDATDNYKYFSSPELLSKVAWLKIHVQSMLGAFIASTTAFTVNTAHYLPWYIQWFGPTLMLLPLQIFWGLKFKRQIQKQEIQVMGQF